MLLIETIRSTCTLQVFAVGVGSGVDKSELNAIATDPDSTHVLTVKDFNQLTQITAQLNTKACAGKHKDLHMNPLTPNGIFYLIPLDKSVSNRRDSSYFFIIIMFLEVPILNTNSVDLDQGPHSATFDLHCLQMSLLLDIRHKWVNR